jgi:hypothetical protein
LFSKTRIESFGAKEDLKEKTVYRIPIRTSGEAYNTSYIQVIKKEIDS